MWWWVMEWVVRKVRLADGRGSGTKVMMVRKW